MDDLISRQAALDALDKRFGDIPMGTEILLLRKDLRELPPTQQWIPCSERLPEVNQRVIISRTDGSVRIAHQGEPDCLWEVIDKGIKKWVYDPDAYTDDIDNLPTTKDCYFEWFDEEDEGYMCCLSVTSPNYKKRHGSTGVIAWMPLPKPMEGGQNNGID